MRHDTLRGIEAARFSRIEHALLDAGSAGIVVDGAPGVGKTTLARTVFEARGGTDVWIDADRVLGREPLAAFGLLLDPEVDQDSLLSALLEAVSAPGSTGVVFVDDAHLLHHRTSEILAQMATTGTARIVAILRSGSTPGAVPFRELVHDHVLDSVEVVPITPRACREIVESRLGGVVSSGVLDLVYSRSGGVVGKVVESLDHLVRNDRVRTVGGVWLFDGGELGQDVRSLDYARVDLGSWTAAQREAYALLVMGGELEVAAMLDLGLGAAADQLVEIGLVRVEPRGRPVYVAVNGYSAAAVRRTASLTWHQERCAHVRSLEDLPSAAARVMRTEWALDCGLDVDTDERLVAARMAIHAGEWIRAADLLKEIPTYEMDPHSLFELARLYCNTHRVPLGLDLLAQCLKRTECLELVVESVVCWLFWDLEQTSPAIRFTDVLAAVDRLPGSTPACGCPVVAPDRAAELLTDIMGFLTTSEPADESEVESVAFDDSLPRNLGLLAAMRGVIEAIEAGDSVRALPRLAVTAAGFGAAAPGAVLAEYAKLRILLQAGRIDEVQSFLDGPDPMTDPAFVATRGGVRDLVKSQVSLYSGERVMARRSSAAAVEALSEARISALQPIALAWAEYLAALDGDAEAAAGYHARYLGLPRGRPYFEERTARAFHLLAGWIRMGDEEELAGFRDRITEAGVTHALGLEAELRILAFIHLDELDESRYRELCGAGTDAVFALLDDVLAAFDAQDRTGWLALADTWEIVRPDLAARCRERGGRGSARRASVNGRTAPEVELTRREGQIARLVSARHTNAEIATELGVSVRTVEGHVYRLFRKLGVTHREELAAAVHGS